MNRLRDIALVSVLDLVADITIVLLCVACAIDIALEKLERTLLPVVK